MTDKSYTLTDNTKRQIKELRSLLSDGRTMTMDEIKLALNRKWVNGVIHHLGDEIDLVKDGRRILGYRLKNVAGRPDVVSAETVQQVSASLPRKKTFAAATNNSLPLDDVTMLDTVKNEPVQTVPVVKRNNIVREARPETKYEPKTIKINWDEIEKNTPDDQKELIIPPFLRRT